MVRKEKYRDLKEENENLRQRIGELEQELRFVRIQQSQKGYKDENMKGLTYFLGDKTQEGACVSKVFELVNEGKKEKARDLLRALFEYKKGDEFVSYQIEDEFKKEDFSMSRKIQAENAKLKATWRFQNLKRVELANIPKAVYEVTSKERALTKEEERHMIPIIPEIIQVYEFLIRKEVIGPDLFKFFFQLGEGPTEGPLKKQRDFIRRFVLLKHLNHTAYFRTKDYGFDKKLIEASKCEEKLVETFERYTSFDKNDKRKEKLRGVGRTLDSNAYSRFTDRGLWNARLEDTVVTEFLSEEIMPKPYLMQLIKDVLSEYDFHTFIRNTFPSDDLIHSVESPAIYPLPKEKEFTFEEECFLSSLSKHGEDTSHYLINRNLESFYRHLRLWDLYERGELPKKDDDYLDLISEREVAEFKDYHLKMSYSNLYIHVYGKQVPEKELETVNLEKLLTLAVEPGG